MDRPVKPGDDERAWPGDGKAGGRAATGDPAGDGKGAAPKHPVPILSWPGMSGRSGASELVELRRWGVVVQPASFVILKMDRPVKPGDDKVAGR
jgi:hypothetical protein